MIHINHEIKTGQLEGCTLRIEIKSYGYETPEPENGFLGGLIFDPRDLTAALYFDDTRFEPHTFNTRIFLDEVIEERFMDMANAIDKDNEGRR